MRRRIPQGRTWRGILLLALLAVLTWQLSRKPLDTTGGEVGPPDLKLNYALYDFSGHLLDEQGRIKLDIAAPVLRNDAESGVGTIESPEIRIQQESDRWYITAESAIVSADREVVNLTGAVNLARLDELTDQVLEIKTSEVVLHITPRVAMTDAGVSVRQSGDRLDAVGMRLDMINERYELLHDVRAYYRTR